MLPAMKFSQARNQLSSLFDDVFYSLKPAIITRRKREEVLLLRPDVLRKLLANFTLKPEILPEIDGTITLALDNLELAVNAPTLKQAMKSMTQELKLYAADYLERLSLFIQAPNRAIHLPYVLKVALCETDAQIAELLEPGNAA